MKKEVTRNGKDHASQEVKTKYFYLQAFLLGGYYCEGMKRFIKLEKIELLSIAKPAHSDIAADAGDAGSTAAQKSTQVLGDGCW